MKSRKICLLLFSSSCLLLLMYTIKLDLLNVQEVKNSYLNGGYILIVENIDDSRIDSDENIFFIESREAQTHTIDSRQACSIESAGEID